MQEGQAPMPQGNLRKQISIDIMKETKKMVAGKTEQQRFQIARQHLFNALDYKTPRIDIMDEKCSKVLKIAYQIQTFFLWRSFLLLISYLFMYTAFFGHVHPSPAQIGVQFGFLFFMIVDVFLEVYHKKFNELRPHSGFQARFYIRVGTLVLLVADEIIVCSTQALPVRPFLIVRCVLPVIYDPQMRKMFFALFAAYIDIFVYLIFYTLIIILFAIMANQFVQFPPNQKYDNYTGNYPELGKSIFLMYVLTTFDAYPDNQLVAIRINIWIYAFFIIFIFLNALFFVTIPTNILLSSIKDTRSKTIIIDEIQQQHNLIMAFISLGGDTIKKIPYGKVVRFLMFVFNNEPRYVDKITQICHNLDEKVDGTIQVTQFMQLCKIIQSKTYLRPPRYNFWKPLNPFQNFVHETLGLKDFIKSQKFQIIIAIFVFLSFVNCILTIYVENNVFDIIDDVIMLIIVIQVVFKLVGLGPQLYFNNILNVIDIFVVVIGVFLETAPNDIIPRNSAVFIKIFRVFRITLLIRYIRNCWNISYKSEIYVKLTKLINQMGLIIPIVLKFFPLYMISFYFLGVIGVQVFWYETEIDPADSPYSFYNQFSNFKTLLGAQFIFVQVLTEAGWSLVAYDHAYRYGTFALTMLFFVICHQVIVIILTSLLKGITWQVYHSIEEQQQSYYDRMQENERNYISLKKRLDQVEQVRQKIENRQNLKPDTLIVRELYEKKIDKQIMARFIELQMKNNGMLFFHKKSKMGVSQPSSSKMEESYPLSNAQLFGSSNLSSALKQQNSSMIKGQPLNSNKQLNKSGLIDSNQIIINVSQSKLVEPQSNTEAEQSVQIEQLKQQDIQKQIDQLLNQVVLHSGIKFSLKMDYPAPFLDYLKQKLKLRQVRHFEGEFDIQKDVFQKEESMVLFTHGLHTLLKIQTSQREQRKMVLNQMVKKGILAPQKANKMLTQKSQYEDEAKFDYNWIIRKTYLSGIDQKVVNKFETEYFSAVYGQSFKQINKSRVYPLMRTQARLTYCLSNLLRYREMSTYQFFNTLIHIQNKISIKLLKPGSLFKFVYQINTNSQSWFSVELKDSNTLRVHFIKNGIWIYHRDLQQDQIYLSNDIFNWEGYQTRPDKSQCEYYIKKFFQSFQSLAFCLNDYDTFFEPEPQKNVYDLYSYYTDVEDTKRYIKKPLSISKIMIVLLSKQSQRKETLNFKLSDLKFEDDEIVASKLFKSKKFRLDETEKQTFQLLKKIQNLNEEDIAQGQGLPYAYIINLLEHLKQIVALGKKNFVYHVQKLLNQHFKAQHDDMVKPAFKKKGSQRPKLQ